MGDVRAPFGPVRNGIDVLIDDGFSAMRDMRLGLITNHSGRSMDGSRTIDVLAASDTVHLDRIFAPEHGLSGEEPGGVAVRDGVDDATGLPVYGLFGERSRLDPERIQGLDALLFDLQDVGCRYYTYLATLGYAMEACAEAGVRVFVLDRPNPLSGFEIDGPSSDASAESIVNYHPLPVRHGLTIGELARLFNGEREIGAKLRVATMAGWQRDYWFDQTGQTWMDPSPNIRDLTGAALYAVLGLVERTNVSVGRGTREPFHILGAPWLDAPVLIAELERAELPGVAFEAVSFSPADRLSPHFGAPCSGVRFVVPDLSELPTGELSLALIRGLRRTHRVLWDIHGLAPLLARPDLLEAIEDDADELDELWQPDPDFFDVRAKYLLY
jgi:uncharacterized protein YbbC (DUF1343 family)